MNEVICTLVKVTVQHLYQVESNSTDSWSFENFADAVAFCERQVEKYRDDPKWRLKFYAVEELQYRRCNSSNPGQLYQGLANYLYKGEDELGYNKED